MDPQNNSFSTKHPQRSILSDQWLKKGEDSPDACSVKEEGWAIWTIYASLCSHVYNLTLLCSMWDNLTLVCSIWDNFTSLCSLWVKPILESSHPHFALSDFFVFDFQCPTSITYHLEVTDSLNPREYSLTGSTGSAALLSLFFPAWEGNARSL